MRRDGKQANARLLRAHGAAAALWLSCLRLLHEHAAEGMRGPAFDRLASLLGRGSSRALRRRRPFPVIPFRGLRLKVDASDHGVVPDMVIGRYERPLLDAFEAEVERLARRGGDGRTAVIDAGAYVGVYSLLAAARGGGRLRVFSFEPGARSLPLLVENVQASGAGGRVSVVAAALGEAPGRAAFHTGGRCACGHSLYGEGEGVEVPVVTLDAYAARHGLWPRLVKLDVEGSEMAAMRGMERVLQQCDPTVFVEINPHALHRAGSSAHELLAHLEARFRTLKFFPFDSDAPPALYRHGDARLRAEILARGGNLVVHGYRRPRP